MDYKKIGEMISKKRKEKGLTQQELGNLLGLSAKTISKWESGTSVPDISLIKDLSKILDVSLENLIEGKDNQDKQNKINNKKLIPFIIIIFLILIAIIIILNQKKENQHQNYQCALVKTYSIIAINDSNDENYIYVTLKEFQEEEVYTAKLSKTIAKDLKINSNYEFTFSTNITDTTEKISNIFKNSKIINIIKTDKTGLEQTNSISCEE